MDDIEQEEIDRVAQIYLTRMTYQFVLVEEFVLTLRESGRNACPCKSLGKYCSSVCHTVDDSNTICMNKRRILESESSDDKSSENSADTDFNQEIPLF